MDDILSYNKYISFFNEIYMKLYSDGGPHNELVPAQKRILFKKGHPAILTKNYCYDAIERFVEDNFEFEDALSFNSIWQFCQFVRYAEKVIMCDNNPNDYLYVDSDILAPDEREFMIKNDDVSYRFKLNKVRDSVNKKEIKVITINVERNFGKKMVNIFTVVDNDVKFNDISDMYLITTINLELYRAMRDKFDIIMKKTLVDEWRE